MNLKQFFLAQKQILEEFFSSEELMRLDPKHPALLRWDLCNKLLKQNGIVKWPEDKNDLSEIASMMLDNSFWSQITSGNVQDLSLGDFANYGDEIVRKKLLSEIIDEEKFFDVMTEISYAAWHLSKNHNISAYEKDGYPDFEVELDGLTLPIAAECKCVRPNKKNRRLKDLIKKAGKQIKKLGKDCYGLTVIDISSKIPEQDQIKDSLPPEVEVIKGIIEQSITSRNTAVSGVLLVWNDYAMLGKPPKEKKSLFVFRRRSILIKHQNPKFVLPEKIELEAIGNTITYSINWTPRKSIPNIS